MMGPSLDSGELVEGGSYDRGIMHGLNRWWIAFAGVCLQMALGSAYAWSVFRIPLAKQFGWSIPQVTLTFTISFFFLGCTSFLGGLWLNRKGPKIVAMTAGVLWGGGVSGELRCQQALAALPQLWRHRRYRPGHRLHRARGSAGEMVSRTKGPDHGDRRWRVWRRSPDRRACGKPVDAKSRRAAYVRVSWHRLFDCRSRGRLVHAKPAQRLEACRVDAIRLADFRAI